MIDKGVDNFEFRVVEECPGGDVEARKVESQRIERYDTKGQPLFNRDRPKKPGTLATARWNGRVHPNRTTGVWFGKFKGDDGRWKYKQVPSTIKTEEEALAWFFSWVTSTSTRSQTAE